jgi:hypothetical protein|tara:strand:- start:306 stop:584 length:279 start_codon:yes stop_codon:yes gene_type:complete
MEHIEKLKQIKKNIDNLSHDEKEEIYKILKNNNCNYTKNNNGIFVNMNQLSEDILVLFEKVIDYSVINKKIDMERLNQVHNIKKIDSNLNNT